MLKPLRNIYLHPLKTLFSFIYFFYFMVCSSSVIIFHLDDFIRITSQIISLSLLITLLLVYTFTLP